MIRIVNYDAGNILNVERAFRKIGAQVEVSSDLNKLDSKKDIVVLPGVGAFGATMQSLVDLELDQKIAEHINTGGKFLGICLGLQLLFEASEETPNTKGLGFFKGTIKKFSQDKARKVPQIGWNNINVDNDFFHDFDDKFFYFVHSYFAEYNKNISLASTDYGVKFSSAIIKENVIAVQFHPEKSGEIGLSFLDKVLGYFND
jgi:imidazole glycerol-phosphate synthase subunit HisH